MIIFHNPDNWTTEITSHTCHIHQKYPLAVVPGCTCSATYGLRAATPQEREENRKRRLENEVVARELREQFFDM